MPVSLISTENAAVFETLHKSKQISVIAMDRLGDYIDLLRIEMKLQGREIAAQLLGYAIGVLFALLAAIFAGLAIIVTYWDTPHRALSAWIVVALYIVIAGAGYFVIRKHMHAASPFTTLRNELKQDVDLVKESI